MAIETIAANKTGAPALEAAYAKIAWHLLPFLAVLWIIAWIDRANIGFAKLEMLDNLKFSEVAFGARRTIARFTIGWGVTSNLMMVVKTTTAFYALRFLLGAFEAGFYPGVILGIRPPGGRSPSGFSCSRRLSPASCPTICTRVGWTISIGTANWRSEPGGMKEIQIFRNEIQARWNKFQIRRNEIQIKMPQFLRRIQPFQWLTLTPPHFLLGRLRLQMPRQSRGRVFAAGLVVGPLVFVFGSSRCFEQVSEGLAPFHDRGRLGVVCPTCRPRSPTSAKREPGVHGQEPRTREKTGRSIRRPARIRPLHQARSGVEPRHADGRQPFMPLGVSHDPCL